jgi:predicted DNA-binding protein (MmcQ/YjbR family)
MDIETFRAYCLAKPGVEETFPFGHETLVFKVMGKMFAAAGLDSEAFTVNLKCDPERALELREQHEEIQPGYHMNKRHWNTVLFEGALGENLLHDLIDHSYDLVVAGLSRREREALARLEKE